MIDNALALFIEKYSDNYEVFKHPLTTVPLAVSKPEGKLHQLKTNYFLETIWKSSYLTLKPWNKFKYAIMMQRLLSAQSLWKKPESLCLKL